MRVILEIGDRFQPRILIRHITRDIKALYVVVKIDPQLGQLTRGEIALVVRQIIGPGFHVDVNFPLHQGLVTDRGGSGSFGPGVSEDLFGDQAGYGVVEFNRIPADVCKDKVGLFLWRGCARRSRCGGRGRAACRGKNQRQGEQKRSDLFHNRLLSGGKIPLKI